MRRVDDAGAVRGRRRGRRWTSVSRGLHHLSETTDPLAELRAWQLVLPPRGRFTGLTAARVLGWWLPALPADLPVFAAVHRGESRPQRPGVRCTRHDPLPPARVVRGLRVDPPAEVLLSCARVLSLLDLVVLVDAALHLGHVTAAELAATAGTRRRGAPRLREALALADGRSESAWETMLRVLHEVCEVAVVPQHELRTGDGGFVARGDLWIVGTTSFHEYDGAQHRERGEHRRDLRRDRAIQAIGWTRRGYTSDDLLLRAVGILRDADRALGRPHRPERIRAWHRLIAASTVTAAGMHALRVRLGLLETGDERQATSG